MDDLFFAIVLEASFKIDVSRGKIQEDMDKEDYLRILCWREGYTYWRDANE